MPGGFCITTAAFDLFIASCPGREELAALLRDAVDAAPRTRLAQSASILNLLQDVTVPGEVSAAVQIAWQRCGSEGTYAVRSSASVEDGANRSFAGQFTSILNVRGCQPLLEAIKACWTSLFSPRALAYHARYDLHPGNTRMAVIVQQMVQADRSGVIFTIDPVSGDDSRLVIEVGRGLGEQVVSGHVVPEQIVVRKASGQVFETEVSDGRTLLNPAQLPLLTKLALEAERLYGHPLDLEWALAQDQPFLLQARPVTAKGGVLARERSEIWLNMNTGEIFPDVATPMTWCMVQHMVQSRFSSLARLLGAEMDRAPWLGLVAGRIYFNANRARRAASLSVYSEIHPGRDRDNRRRFKKGTRAACRKAGGGGLP